MTAPTPRRPRVLRLAVAAAAAALALAGCGDDTTPTATDTETDTETETTSSSEPTPSEPTSEDGDTGGTGGTTDTVTVPIYFAGDGPSNAGRSRGPLLFREFRKVQADNPMDEAVALLVAGDALDPDYRSPFPAGARWTPASTASTTKARSASPSPTAASPSGPPG